MATIDRPWTDDATEEDIYYCFRLILGRTPNREELKGHFARAGQDLAGVVRSYVRSPEFARRAFLDEVEPAEVELTQLDGFSIYTSAQDLAVGQHVRTGTYEPAVTALFRRFLKPGMTVIDVGANIGFYSLLAASIVGTDGYVLAVEPNVQNVRLLEASRRVNSFGQLIVAYAAAGRNTGVLALNTSYSNGTTSTVEGGLVALMTAHIVPCFALSAMAPADRRIDFIKIDIEGAEHAALSGATDLLRRDRPIIVSEFSPGSMEGISGVTGPEYLRFLAGLGYRLAVIDMDSGPIEGDLDSIMTAYRTANTDHIDILAVPAADRGSQF